MKKLVTASLFIFWAVVTAVLVAGLVAYQQNNVASQPLSSFGNSSVNSSPSGMAGGELALNLQEIAKHNTVRDCWLIINNKVYNVTSYLFIHPGGSGMIFPYCGKEATRAFQTKDIGRPHSSYADSLLASYYLGELNQKITSWQIEQKVQNANSILPPAGRNREYEDD